MFLVFLIAFAIAEPVVKPVFLSEAADKKCRATAEFKKLCEICAAGKSSKCKADVPNHGSSKEFMALTESFSALNKACGIAVPANHSVFGTRDIFPKACRNESRIPDSAAMSRATHPPEPNL